MRLLVFSAILLLVIQGCSLSGSGDRYIPVFTSQPRISTLGFTVSPPPGRNWYEKVNDGSLVYLKRLPTEHYFFYTQASELRFERHFSTCSDFAEYVRQQKEINTDPRLFKNSRFSYQKSGKAKFCVRYQQQYEDHSPLQSDSNTADDSYDTFVHVSSNGLICLHPDNPAVGIDLYYLERSLSSYGAMNERNEEGETFLDSLSFLPIKKLL